MTSSARPATDHEAGPRDAPIEHGAWPGLALAAVGIVFGDIGTSPLYSLKTVFSADHNAVAPTRADVFGVTSMVFWAITIIVCYGYAFLIMKADNDGEGGILSLVALIRRKAGNRPRLVGTTIIMGICGAALFYGDSVITPAISVLSSIEGLTVVNPGFEPLILPLALAVIVALFALQRFGTGMVGKFFGPVMVLWFVTIAILGLPHVIANPDILGAISPHHALAFAITQPWIAFVALGAVVLTCTGVEALYADMGHFGPKPIRIAWFGLVFPSLVIAYFGMGAMILDNPATIDNPFFHLAPDWAQFPLVILATLATVIASQAVIAGAFSVSRQAMRAGLLPRLKVTHTSQRESGQIYIATVNWVLLAGVVVLIAVFRSSEALASAYGVAVTGTLLLEISIFLLLAHFVWRVRPWKIWVAVALIVTVEAVFFAASLTKILHGGWVPLIIAGTMITIMLTWRQGRAIVARLRREREGPLDDFLTRLHKSEVRRVPGLAVFPHPNKATTPLALRKNVEFNQALHEQVVIVSMSYEGVPHIPHINRARVDNLGDARDGIVHVTYRIGFNDSQKVPAALFWANDTQHEVDIDPDRARYFVSSFELTRREDPSMPRWRRRLFLWLASLQADRSEVFGLPQDRTVVIGERLEV